MSNLYLFVYSFILDKEPTGVEKRGGETKGQGPVGHPSFLFRFPWVTPGLGTDDENVSKTTFEPGEVEMIYTFLFFNPQQRVKKKGSAPPLNSRRTPVSILNVLHRGSEVQ